MAKVSVIIPVYNEEEGIENLVGELNSYIRDETRFSTEIIFVNDGSTDNTLTKLKQAT